jgi:hypothetical protein
MSKLSTAGGIEASKYKATKAGQELNGLIDDVSTLTDDVVKVLRNGVGIRDNLDAKLMTVSLTHNTLQALNTDGKTPVGIVPIRVYSTTYGMQSFIWYVDGSGKVQIKATYSATPTDALDVTLVIYFS